MKKCSQCAYFNFDGYNYICKKDFTDPVINMPITATIEKNCLYLREHECYCGSEAKYFKQKQSNLNFDWSVLPAWANYIARHHVTNKDDITTVKWLWFSEKPKFTYKNTWGKPDNSMLGAIPKKYCPISVIRKELLDIEDKYTLYERPGQKDILKQSVPTDEEIAENFLT